jgi:lysozyme
LHETFKFSSTTGYEPPISEGAKTYAGSGGAGNNNPNPPVNNTDRGNANKELPPPKVTDSIISKDINIAAFKCQIKYHEGPHPTTRPDLVATDKLVGGWGHLLRPEEAAQYPLGSAISDQQADIWLEQDTGYAIANAQRLVGMDTWNKLSDVRKRAVADLSYNMGTGPKGLGGFKKFISALQAGDYDKAGMELKDSRWYGQVGRRANNIINMISKDVDSTGCGTKFPQA